MRSGPDISGEVPAVLAENSRTASLFGRGKTPSRRFSPSLKKPHSGFFSKVLGNVEDVVDHPAEQFNANRDQLIREVVVRIVELRVVFPRP